MSLPPAALADRLLGTIPVVLGVIATAGLVHFGTILAYPTEVQGDAFTRVAAVAPVGIKTVLPPERRLPFRDAALAAVVCRFDLDTGPFRIATPALAQGFVSIGFYDRRGRAFSGLNLHDSENPTVVTVLTPEAKRAWDAVDTSGDEDRVLPVVAPERTGVALIEVPLDRADLLDRVTCGPA